MRTYRRLDDPTRFYGLSWRGWLAVSIAGTVLYTFVKVSPFDARVTISVLLIVSVLPGMAAFAASGQALGAGRYLTALLAWACGAKDYALSARTPAGGVVVATPPPAFGPRRAVSVLDEEVDRA